MKRGKGKPEREKVFATIQPTKNRIYKDHLELTGKTAAKTTEKWAEELK